jgi:putative endonuclease
MDSTWYVYIVSCRDQTLYTGITNDPDRRLREHNSTKNGAIYTRGRRPVTLVYLKRFPSRSAASRCEHLIKKLTTAGKNQLVRDQAAHQLQTDMAN